MTEAKGERAPEDSGNSLRAWSATIFTAAPALVLFVDLCTKKLASQSLSIRMGRSIIPGCLSFQYSENAGAVFGIGQGMQKWLLLGTVVAVGVILWAIHRYARETPWLSLGLGLLLGGALGNAWDRLMLNVVRDFIDVYLGSRHWPTFNVADVAICVGAVIVGTFAIRDPKHLARR
jgi:signal peptidase II